MGGVQKCQFCGADVSKIAVPKATAPVRKPSVNVAPSWCKPAYYVLSGFWALTGIGIILLAYVIYPKESQQFGILNTLLWGITPLALGVSMFFKENRIRKFFLYVHMVNILRRFLNGALISLVFPKAAPFLILFSICEVVLCVLTLYLMSEVDDFAFDD